MTSPQYKKVLNNKGTIVEALKLTPGARGVLVTKFQEKEWLLITENPTEEKLVDTVLGRIKRNPANLTTFIGMLNDVTGLDQIMETLEDAPSLTDRTSRQSTDKASRQSSQGRVDLATIISKKQLDKIAGELLTDWEELSPSLDLTQAQEKNIRKTHGEYADQKREALRAWKRNKGNGATFGALISAAEDVSNMQLADGIRDLIKTLRVETERSHQSQLGEQYDDEPDSGDEKKKPKTKPHQEGQLKSDSGPRSLTEEPDIRRRKKKVTMDTPPEDDEKSDTNTPPPVEGNGGQSEGTRNNEEDSEQKKSKGSDLVMEASKRGVYAKAKNMTEQTAIYAIRCLALMFMVIVIAYIIGQCVNSYITTK